MKHELFLQLIFLHRNKTTGYLRHRLFLLVGATHSLVWSDNTAPNWFQAVDSASVSDSLLGQQTKLDVGLKVIDILRLFRPLQWAFWCERRNQKSQGDVEICVRWFWLTGQKINTWCFTDHNNIYLYFAAFTSALACFSISVVSVAWLLLTN